MYNLSPQSGKNMEQDYIAGLYQSLGMSVGVEFSSENVSALYRKVFHVSLDTKEANTAIKKITGCDNSNSCTGENILGVLLEMESEREKKEILYWDLQLLNTENFAHMDGMQENTDSKTHNTDPESEIYRIHTVKRKKEPCGRVASVRRLKKAARQCWARLASDGVQSILPPPCQAQRTVKKCQAWGCVSMSDLLLLVEVKYDVVSRLLYTEMLQEHHTESIWEMLLPWQQHKEVEELEALAEEALESVDVLCMAELPGAFRMYQNSHTHHKTFVDGIIQSCPESETQSWSAVSFLNDLHTFRQHEQQTLTVLSERLCAESLRLLCLHIRLATLRAQREKKSYSALLAARQSFETWPHVTSPCRAEQVTVWLYSDEEEEKEEEDFKKGQQALLQLLVLIQEQERKHLVKLVNGVSLEDLQGPDCTVSSIDESHTQAALRNGCVKRLRQIYAWQQTHNQSKMPQSNLKNYALLLLTHLVEVQEVQASLLLQALMDENAQRICALQERYEFEIQAQRFTSLLHLLCSEAPLPSESSNHPSLIENSEDLVAKSDYTRQVKSHDVTDESAEAQMGDLSQEASRGLQDVQPTDDTNKQDVCSGCGAIMEDLPYLEISCASDAKRDVEETLPTEGGAKTQDEESVTKTQQSYEKQGSLITLAWSKPPEDGADDEAEARDTKQTVGSSTQIQIQLSQCEENNQETQEEPNAIVLQSSSTNQQCNIIEQPGANTTPIADQPQEEEAISDQDLQINALQLPQLADSTEHDPHAIDICSGTSNDSIDGGEEETEVETCPTEEEFDQWDPKETVSSHHDHQNFNEASVNVSETNGRRGATLKEKGRMKEPVSAVEREKTMRNLVDMQRKFEQKQQRDRERQMLRVQERLSIIQNRKAEEDLLGLKHTDRLKHLTQDLPLEDKNQQKTIVRERLEQLRRERSYIMQSKRDKNTAGFRELLGPVVIHSREAEDGEDWDTTTV